MELRAATSHQNIKISRISPNQNNLNHWHTRYNKSVIYINSRNGRVILDDNHHKMILRDQFLKRNLCLSIVAFLVYQFSPQNTETFLLYVYLLLFVFTCLSEKCHANCRMFIPWQHISFPKRSHHSCQRFCKPDGISTSKLCCQWLLCGERKLQRCKGVPCSLQ